MGGLDHVAIYNRALSSDEIGQLVNKDSVDEGLLVLWDMNETSGMTLADTAGGNANWIEGHMEGGLQLDGEYVSVSDLPDVTSTTWAAWARLDAEANYSTAIAATFEGAGAGHTLVFTRMTMSESLGFCGIIRMDTYRSCRQIRLSSGNGTI